MTCQEARQAMLTAEPADLRGSGDARLAHHIRSCLACRDAATRILQATDLLAAQLSDAARTTTTRKTARRSFQPAWVTLPLAAALAALLVTRPAGEPQIPRVGNLEKVRRPVLQPVVNAPANRNVAVFNVTEKITVVWDLGSKGGS